MASAAKEIRTERRRQAEAVKFTEVAFLCNITEQEFVQQYSFGEIRVEPCAEDEEYRVTRVEWRAERQPSEKNTTVTEIGALEIAKDVARLCNADIGEKSYAGVFVIANGDKPAEAELKEAHRRLTERYKHCVADARGTWQRTRNVAQITDEHRRAARYLNLVDEEWMSEAQGQELCEGCGKPHMAGIAKCGHCGAILDVEKARKLGLLPPHMMEAKTKTI
ncbi:MAG: hypothetical protein NVS9B14_06760 [Candidatus Acidiferrum sp.]